MNAYLSNFIPFLQCLVNFMRGEKSIGNLELLMEELHPSIPILQLTLLILV